ncbi:MAG: Spermine synthase [Thermoleophilia bacterium]|nr:Spermine synthase [Thermoleophilia bacterium]
MTADEPPRDVTPARPALGVMSLVVFLVGVASLGAEIAAARLLAPYFGASTIIWANTIATVLLALSLGYALGGRLADRRPSRGTLAGLLIVSGALLGAVPIVAAPVLDLASGALADTAAGPFAGSLVAVLLLIAIPLALIGAVTPLALRLSLVDVASAGRISGRLSAISTAGALIGTFLSALLLVPFIGTRRTFLVFGLMLVLPGVLLAWRRARSGSLVALLLVVGIIAPAPADSSPDGRVVASADTEYQHVRVVETESRRRLLELNEGVAVHSVWERGAWLTGGYWDEPLVLAGLVADAPPPARVAILGAAAGTTARAFTHFYPTTHVDAVELDGELEEIGTRWFGLETGPRLDYVHADARPFIRTSTDTYDLILVDAYRQPYIPFYLTTREFFGELRARLSPGGVVVINVGHTPGSSELERVIARSARTAFGHVVTDQFDDTNVEVVASRQPLAAANLAAGRATLPRALQPLADDVASRIRPARVGTRVFTDDRAPVEWLVDGSLLDFATSGDDLG